MDSYAQAILRKFEDWLRLERGLAAASVRTYVMHAVVFVDWLSVQAGASLTVLNARLVVRFVKFNAERGYSFNYLITRHNALRCFLRFLHGQGLVGQSLDGAVPPVAGWKLSSIPRGLEAAQVEALLGCFDVSTAAGLRDRAMVVLMARLGLRRIEVARLCLDDVDWRAGALTLTGKAMKIEQLPLLSVVGEALSDYLVRSRPQSDSREVFLTVRKPFRPISSDVVGAVMGRASARAGLGQVGAHRLRHTLAIGLLDSGSGLAQIGQVLRHESALATAIYAKVDYHRLAELARPWPEHR